MKWLNEYLLAANAVKYKKYLEIEWSSIFFMRSFPKLSSLLFNFFGNLSLVRWLCHRIACV